VEEADMDRVAIVALCWFIVWVALGYGIGGLIFGTPWTGAVSGFWFALLAILAWPWVMPEQLNVWMDDAAS
jgi:hypothetical protein